MNLRFLGFLGLWVVFGFSCSGEPPEVVDDAVVDGGGGSGGGPDPLPPAPGESPDAPPPPPPENNFDPCPEDTYVLWEEDGIKYTVVIEVFCEPVRDMNLGCPAPNVR